MAVDMVSEKDLAVFDDSFASAEEPDYSNVPDGNYVAKVDEVEVRRSHGGNLGLSQKLVIIEGEFAGRTLFRWNTVPEKGVSREQGMQQLGYLKKDLKAYGVDTGAKGFLMSAFLTKGLGGLLDRVCEVTVKTKAGATQPNVYLNKFLRMDGGGAGASAETSGSAPTAAAGESFDPFKDE